MAVFRIKKGRELNIEGKPSPEIEAAPQSRLFALLPPDFPGIRFKLEIAEGDAVKAGTPLLSSRENPELKFTSPAGGLVSEIKRGEKRKLLAIVIESQAGEEEFQQYQTYSPTQIKEASREDLIRQLLHSGLWPYLIQRPFSRVANPQVTPKAIFIRAMETQPNCAEKQMLVQSRQHLQAGVALLTKLTRGKVYLCWGGKEKNSLPANFHLGGVEPHQFIGPHPAGNVGTHIHYLDPLNKGEVVWHIEVEHLAVLGRFLLEGEIPVERIVAVAGSSAKDRKYFKTRMGASLQSIIQGKTEPGETRYINGGILTGSQSLEEGYLGFYNSTLTLIPEGIGKETVGWMKPGFDKPTFSRMFASAFLPQRPWRMNTLLNGEPRPIVATHLYDPLVALDVHTNFLVKACLAGDIEAMEELGILECAPEDFSLCTYACISKLEVDSIIRQGLELMEREG